MSRVLVTGGSGFIGTNLINLLTEEGFTILNLDLREPRNADQLNLWRCVDILDSELLFKVFDDFKPDFVVHLAARTDISSDADLKDYNVNIEGVNNIMTCSSRHKYVKRTIVASSMLVCEVGYIPTSFTDFRPTTVYGQSKVCTEMITREFNIDWVLVRPTSIWGPWFGPPHKDFFDMVLKGNFFNLPKRYAAVKTYGYVENTSLQLFGLLIGKNTEISKNTFYLGDETPINISLWAELISELSFRKVPRILPLFVFKVASMFGDLLGCVGINFPLTSFRLKNMTTSNVLDIKRTNSVLDKFVISRFSLSLSDNVSQTLNWVNQKKK